MSDWREIAYEADRDSGSEYGGEDFDTEIARLRARIRELEKIIHERDLDIVELAEDRNEWIVAGAAESRRAAEAERKLADRDARMFKLEAFVEEVRKVLDYEDWHPSEWHRFLRHSIPSAAAEGGGA